MWVIFDIDGVTTHTMEKIAFSECKKCESVKQYLNKTLLHRYGKYKSFQTDKSLFCFYVTFPNQWTILIEYAK